MHAEEIRGKVMGMVWEVEEMENGQLHCALPCASEGNTVQAIVEAHRGLGNPTEVWVPLVGGIRADDRARSPRLHAGGRPAGRRRPRARAYDPMAMPNANRVREARLSPANMDRLTLAPHTDEALAGADVLALTTE